MQLTMLQRHLEGEMRTTQGAVSNIGNSGMSVMRSDCMSIKSCTLGHMHNSRGLRVEGPEEGTPTKIGKVRKRAKLKDTRKDANCSERASRELDAWEVHSAHKDMSIRFSEIARVCNREEILWTKVRGYMYWPSQIVEVDAHRLTKERFQQLLRFKRKNDDTCVRFFGTGEVAWVVRSSATLPWMEGICNGFHLAPKTRKDYKKALQDVLEFCEKKEKECPIIRSNVPNSVCADSMSVVSSKVIGSNLSSKEALAAEFRRLVELGTFQGLYREHLRRAELNRVCWVKLCGYPHWPVQVLPANVAITRFPDLHMKPPNSNAPPCKWPCIFFGTKEVSMVASEFITPLSIGVERGFVNACKSKIFCGALAELWQYIKTICDAPNRLSSRVELWDDRNSPHVMKEGLRNVRKDFVQAKDISRKAIENTKTEPLSSYTKIEISVWPSEKEELRALQRKHAAVCKCNRSRWNSSNKGGVLYCSDKSCLNVAANVLCDPKRCPAGDGCRNKPFQLRRPVKVELFYTADGRGWGLQLREAVKEGAFLIEFVGEILNEEAHNDRLKRKYRQGDLNFYMMELGDGLTIDAEYKGNSSRFINCSCLPNCRAYKWLDSSTGQTRIGIFALKDIAAGTELTMNYCYGWTDAVVDKKWFLCKCGSENCWSRNTERIQWIAKILGKRVRVQWDDGWYNGTITSYDEQKMLFEVVYDDGDVEHLTLGLPLVKSDGVQFRLLNNDDTELADFELSQGN